MGAELEALRRNSDRRTRHIRQKVTEILEMLAEERREIEQLTKRKASPG